MNPRLSICFKSLIIGALFVAQSFAITVLPMYPQYRLTPASPTTQDSVSFWLVKGISGVSCVPVYGTSIRIEQEITLCKMAPCPPINVIKISYRELVVETFAPIPCYNVQTEYGPNFNFGKLPAGDYSIIDSTDSNRTLMQFTVTENPLPYANKAQITIDNVTYTTATDKALYNVGENINVRYTIKNNSSATVIDSLPCCSENLLAMTTSGDTAYHRGGLVCPCPLGYPPVSIAPGDSFVSNFSAFSYTDTARSLLITARLGWVGSYYSTPAVSVLVGINQTTIRVVRQDVEKASGKNAPLVTYSRSSKTLAITSDRPQFVSISAYTLSGRKVAELSGKRYLSVGTQTISLKNAAFNGGVMLFRIQGEGFIETARINFIN